MEGPWLITGIRNCPAEERVKFLAIKCSFVFAGKPERIAAVELFFSLYPLFICFVRVRGIDLVEHSPR